MIAATATETTARPVANAIGAEVRRKVRESGIVFWLDAGSHYASVVHAIERREIDFPYPLVKHSGSFLDLMIALADYGNGLRPEHLLVYLPGLNKESVRETPVFELYAAGTTFERNLTTLVRDAAVGIAKPDEIDAFVRAPELTVDKADEWLTGLRDGARDRVGILFDALGVEGVVLGLASDDARIRAHLPDAGARAFAFLEKNLGVTPSWRSFVAGERPLDMLTLARIAASWLMAVEFVHDLREAPVTPELAPLAKLGPFAERCRKLVVELREKRPDDYEHWAAELQELLASERTSHRADALGSIDTFRFEEVTTRIAALGELARGEWAEAERFADDRTPEQSFWVKRSKALERTWEIVRLAAKTGKSLAATRHVLDRCTSLDEAVARYVDELAAVDRMHRVFEERAHAVIASDLEEYDALLEVRTAVRNGYRDWADHVNRAFFDVCVKYGALPARNLRQRAIYEDVVHPLAERGERVAFFLVDALRFEMAQALAKELESEKYRVVLEPRLAELPTETKIGMNVLAPVERTGGRLRLVMKGGAVAGFAAAGSNDFTVAQPADRVRAMSDRSLASKAAVDLELEELRELGLTDLKKRLGGKASFVVVRSRELDTAGEHGLHLGTFRQTLDFVRSAVSLLSQAGIERFVIASDHGFLLQDATTENIPIGANMRVAQRRHALLDQPSGKPDVLEIKLSDLDYDVDGAGPSYLVFRPDTAVWQTKEKVAPFVHGGNSLQERVVPVLVIERRLPRGKTISRYEVVAHAEAARLGRQRLRVAVRLQSRETGSLGFVAPKTVSLSLRVVDNPTATIHIHDATPPASMQSGRIMVPPNRDEAIVEFEIEGADTTKARVEIFHPDAAEDVTPKVVDGFFDVVRSPRAPKPDDPQKITKPPEATAELVGDEHYTRVIKIIGDRGIINELELAQVLGSPRRVRAFSRHIDTLVAQKLVPFDIEIVTANGMKAYKKRG